MLLCEHLAKELFAARGIPTPEGIRLDPERLADARPPFAPPFIVKSQVLAGGRGKAGGVRKVADPAQLPAAARSVLELEIKGQKPPYLRVEPAVAVTGEYYLSLAVSRERKSLVLTAGPGGVDVEAAAEALLIQDVPALAGLRDRHIRAAFYHLGLDGALFKEFAALVRNLYAAVAADGLLLAEINPLAVTGDGRLLALDGKVEIDDNEADLRPDLIERYYDPQFVNPEEARAKSEGLSFIKLNGWVGLMVNGAGLAMVTMDILNLAGLPAANFLDLGGAADAKRMRAALSLLFGDPAVKAVCVNLYGGILSCAKVAEAIRDVLGGKAPEKPLVARLSGNSAEEGQAILRDLNLPDLHVVADIDQAVAALERIGKRGQPVRPPEIRVLSGDEAPGREGAESLIERVAVGPSPFALGPETGICVQGITGKVGGLHARLMREYGGRVVCGVTPGKGGQSVDGAPVYNSIRQAQKEHRIDVCVQFVPARLAPDAILEAADAAVPFVACITEGIPQRAMLDCLPQIDRRTTMLIGPNTPGLIVPGAFKAGIMPATPFSPGDSVAVFSRSGTLTYEACDRLTKAGVGQALAVGIGGDPFIGTGFLELAELARREERIKTLLVLGEIGGRAEEDLAAYAAATNYPKPIVAFIAGVTAPPGRRLGHAGAIIERAGGVTDKLSRLQAAGVVVCRDLSDIAPAVAKALRG